MPHDIIARALTIAGSDSGGGAGIEADLKTFTMLGVYGMAALTSVTAQNTVGVTAVHDLPPDFVGEQIDVVARDIGVDAVKTGMLSNTAIVEAVAAHIEKNRLRNVVLDPVMIAKSGDALLQETAQQVLRDRLLPLATMVTPNIPEAQVLAGVSIADLDGAKDAARRIHALGPRYVLMKGGHLDSEHATDYLFDGAEFLEFSAARIVTRNTHGTGCTYSSAIAAFLAKGFPVPEAVEHAKHYLTRAIECAFDLGQGHGPLNHFWPLG